MEREPLHVEMRRAREEKDISLSDFYESTRIRMELLEALEQGQYDVLPTPYIRLFLRAYAEKVDLDPQYVLGRYEEAVNPRKARRVFETPRKPPADVSPKPPTEQAKKPPSDVSPKPPTEQAKKPPDRKPKKSLIKIQERPPVRIPWRGAIATAMVVIVGVVAIMMGRSEREPGGGEGVEGGPALERAEFGASEGTGDVLPADSPSAEDTASSAEAVSFPGGEGTGEAQVLEPEVAVLGPPLTLIARPRDSTWVRIDGDRRTFFQGILAAGEERAWTAQDTFFVISGKPLGIQFVFQGEPVPPDMLPKAGVLQLGLSREGIDVGRSR